jgi:hypothetical protein
MRAQKRGRIIEPDVEAAQKKREQYNRLRGKLLQTRSAFEGTWRDVADHIAPWAVRFLQTESSREPRRSVKILDSTAQLAARTLRSGLHAGISSPSRPWFKLSAHDPGLNAYGPVKDWLHAVTTRMYTVFQLSNLYQAMPVSYLHIGCFGTAGMSILEDTKHFVRAYTHPVGSYAVGLDRRQVANTWLREYPMTVEQVVSEFGRIPDTNEINWENISQSTKNKWDQGDTQHTVPVCWMVQPNKDFDPKRLQSKYLPWISVHFEKGSDSTKLLREEGFNEFPILAPRWDITGEDSYGTACPGFDSLGDTRQLQVMQRRKSQGVEIAINPSLQAPTSLRNQKISMLPADVTFVDMLQQKTAAIRPIREISIEGLRFFTEDIKEIQARVKDAFYESLFLMLAQSDGPRMTAREVAERHEEKLLALGPVFERLNDEYFDPLIDRVFSVMDRRGLIPVPPPEMDGQQLKIEYTSLIAQSQRLVGAASLDRFLQSVSAIAERWPEARHKVRVFAVVDEYGEMLGVNPHLIVADDEAQKALQAEQQAAAQQRESELMEQGSKTARNLAGSDLENNNALKRLIDLQQGQGAPQ